MALPGQTFTNGISNLLFGANTPPDYGSPPTPVGFVVSSQVQALVKAAGVTVMRITISNGTTGYTNAQIDQRLNACKNAGCLPLVILGHSVGWTFNLAAIQYIGSRCNLYEMYNEPDISGISVSTYSSDWNTYIPQARKLNAGAAFGGPTLGVSPANFTSYIQPWLQNCKTSGVIPDFVSFHQYPCGSQPAQFSQCLAKAPSIGTSAATLRSLIQSVLGYTLPIAVTEWNMDYNTNPVSYADTTNAANEGNYSQWESAVFAGLVQNNVDMACIWDTAGNAEGGKADMIQSQSPYGILASYTPFKNEVATYLGGGNGGGGSTTITASPSTLSFSATVGGSNPASQTVTLTNTGTVSGTWQISIAYSTNSGNNAWLTASQASGTLAAGASTTITLQAILGSLAAGTYTASVTYPSNGTTTESVTFTVSPAGGSITPLSVYFASAHSSTLAAADALYDTAGTPTTTQTYTTISTQTGYVEIFSQGGTATAGGSIGSPSGKGFMLDSSVLNLSGQNIPSGTWSAVVRLNAAQGVSNPQAGTLKGDLYVRAYKYNPASSVYTLITTMALPNQTITYAFTSFSLSASGVSAVSFASGETLYVDIWLDVTTNSNGGNVNQGIRLNRLSTDTSGKTGDGNAVITTPGYQSSGASNLTAAPSSLSFAGVASISDPVNTGSVTLTNTTNTSGSWTSSISYGSGSGWLALSPSSGTLAAGASATVTVTASNLTGGLAAGTYTATITFTKGSDTATVGVTLVVSSSATSIVTATPSTLSFGAQAGVNPASQSITLSNTGSTSGTYTSNISYANSGNWLSLAPSTGTLAPGTPVVVTATVNVSGLAVGTKTATITFTLGSTTATVTVTLFVSASGVAHVLTNAGANLIVAGLSGADNPLVKYLAIGSGTNAPQVTDTQLQAEFYRKAITAYTPGTNPGEMIINGYLSPSDAINADIEEVGIFGGNSATSAPNTGVLIARGLYHHNPKTSLESITIPFDLTIQPG